MKPHVIYLGLCFLLPCLVVAEVLPIEGAPRVVPAQQVVHAERERSEGVSTVRIGSYNIQDFFEGREGGRRTWAHARRQGRLAAAILDEIRADVLLLQEIETPAMLALLNDKLAEPYPYGYITALGASENRSVRLNLAVLSRLPLQDVTEVDFSPLEGPGRPTRGLMRFGFALDAETQMLVYNLHLKANWGDRQRNVAQRYHALLLLQEDLARQREQGFDGIVLVGGDFNFDPARPEYQLEPSLVHLANFVDLWEVIPEEERITIPTRQGAPALVFPAVSFDRFYLTVPERVKQWRVGSVRVLSQGVNLEDNQRIAGEDETTASDHYPIYFDLEQH